MSEVLAWASIIALVIAIIISCVTTLNIGFLSIAFAFIVGIVLGGMKVADVIKGFPISLFFTLIGVSYLFSIADSNGTLEKLTIYFIRSVRGRVAFLPIIYFVIAFALSSIGPGSIASTAILAPTALLSASQMGISPFLMSLMVIHGGIGGGLSPIATGGVICNGVVAKLGLPYMGDKIFLSTMIVSTVLAAVVFILFGGFKLLREKKILPASQMLVEKFTPIQLLTVAGIGLLVFVVIFLNLDVGLMAISIAVVLSVLDRKTESKAIKSMPWSPILLVTGVTVLIDLMGRLGGTDILASGISNVSTPATVALTMSFTSALVSVYASTAVVWTTFLSLVPGVLLKVGGGNPVPVILSIAVAGALVDASPLSTLGALALAAAPEKVDKHRLYRNLMIWGLSMCVIGSVMCWFLFSVLNVF
ncbi:C4-dicarboxylate ABC transporter [Candidatus Bathyarchaeota archaeon]|nr:C4-dicarboxylate ABC transporter [Candidatus Bathyarchaeota archaeon]